MKKIIFISICLMCIIFFLTISTTVMADEVAVIVNQDLQPFIQSQLDAYILDLQTQGYNTFLTTCITDPNDPNMDTPEIIRQMLEARLASGLVGAVLIGNVPAADFEIPDHWQLHTYIEFPTDVYYMDLDGQWTDNDGNDIWDWYTVGDMEIWVSRLRFPDANEDVIINSYLHRVHDYKTKVLQLPRSALLTVDRDWNDSTGSWNNAMEQLYSSISVVAGPAYNDVTDVIYKDKLTESREWTRVACHSAPTRHEFDENMCYPYWPYQCVYYSREVTCSQIEAIDPPCFFYDLFACSSCRFTHSSDYLGGSYLSGTYGLGALGPTAPGAIIFPSNMYAYLGSSQEPNLGEALIYHLDHNDGAVQQAANSENVDWEWFW